MTDTQSLTGKERQGLADALDDESKARTTYTQVITDFVGVRPFMNIVAPQDHWTGAPMRFSSLSAACAEREGQ